MPIDFAAIAAQFEPRIQGLLKPLTLVFVRLGKWLKPRAAQIAGIEQATRHFPVLRFYNEALTAYIDASQRGVLTPLEPPASTLESVGRGARHFPGGFERIPEAVREERIVPNFLRRINDLLEAVMDSIERHRRPTPELFDPNRPRRFLDIIGQSVLFFRATGSSLRQIDLFTGNARVLRDAYAETFGRTSAQADAAGQAALAGQPAFQRFDDIGRLLTGVILALPAFGSLLGTLVEAAVIRGRTWILDMFQDFERRIFGLRSAAIELFAVDLLDFSEQALRFLAATGTVVGDNLRFFLVFTLNYVEQTLASVTDFLGDLSRWINEVMDLLGNWLHGMLSFLDTEIIDPGFLLGPSFTLGTVLKDLPTVTLRDLLLDNAEAIGNALVAAILTIHGEISRSLTLSVGDWLSGKNVRKRLLAAAEVVLTLTRRRIRDRFLGELSPGGAFRRPLVHFPDLFEAFFGPGAPNFGESLERTRDSLERDVTGVLDSGTLLLDGLGTRFAVAANRAAQLDPRRYRQMAEAADRLAESVFGGQAPPAGDPLARAFDAALARGGFELIGNVIPIYVIAMERYWEEQRASDVEVRRATPTSPHILARRQRLGRIEVPVLVIRLRGRPMDANLTETTAEQFQQSLNGIYRSGLERHRAGAEPGPG